MADKLEITNSFSEKMKAEKIIKREIEKGNIFAIFVEQEGYFSFSKVPPGFNLNPLFDDSMAQIEQKNIYHLLDDERRKEAIRLLDLSIKQGFTYT
jgi:hypothetical protein